GSDLDDAAVFEQKIVLTLKMLSGVEEETVTDCEAAFIVHAKSKTIGPDLRFSPKFRAQRGIPITTID
ncbi:MAG: hypothetical protein ACXVKC_16300, partial [Candidatus Angelobacter sp.]